MTNFPFSAIVLAAGKGTRMRSGLPKVMHPLAGFPLLWHVLSAVKTLSPSSVTVVTAPGMEAVHELASSILPDARFAVQEKQLGTGHAVLAARRAAEAPAAHIVLYGDTPLIRAETIARLLEKLRDADLAVLGMRPDDAKEYGRLITRADGALEAIVEYKDADEQQRAIGLCNSGVMAVAGGRLFELLAEVTNANAKGEYYLTDIVAVARARGLACAVVEAPASELLGINCRAELAEAERACQQSLRARAMAQGGTLLDPATVYFSADTELGRDVLIEPNVFFGPGVAVGDGTAIRAFSHLEGVRVGEDCIVGPFARLRPGAVLENRVHIGNFVEVKNTRLAEGAKANHLSYLGDARIGERTNIGAGTITCNYDGFDKHRTVIGQDVFVGSHSTLIAPLTIGDGAIIGAGSTVSVDVAKDALALARTPLAQLPDGAARFREKREKP